jgi:dTDP-D-glucose 4,6-dehydratase
MYELVDFHSSRPGHDLRYALDGGKLRNMGFSFASNLEQDLDTVVEWSIRNARWIGVDVIRRRERADPTAVFDDSQLVHS